MFSGCTVVLPATISQSPFTTSQGGNECWFVPKGHGTLVQFADQKAGNVLASD